MSEYNAKNYTEQGGEVTHIGGKIVYDNGFIRFKKPSNWGTVKSISA